MGESRRGAQYAAPCPAAQSRFCRRAVLTGGLAALGVAPLAGGPMAMAAVPEGPLAFEARVTAVPDGRSLRLSDGSVAVLPHILPPGPDRHAPMADTAPIRIAAAMLADLALGRRVRLDLLSLGRDRHGRLRARVTLPAPSGTDLAAALAAAGSVRVFPEPGARQADIAPLLAAERQARRTGTGFWADGVFRRAAARPYDGGIDRFEIVFGTVRGGARIGRRQHLEFGDDWRTDFTAGIAAAAYRDLFGSRDAAYPIGRALEVRGWVRRWNGPFMEIGQPAQVIRPAIAP